MAWSKQGVWPKNSTATIRTAPRISQPFVAALMIFESDLGELIILIIIPAPPAESIAIMMINTISRKNSLP
jgi:hypothetical protein